MTKADAAAAYFSKATNDPITAAFNAGYDAGNTDGTAAGYTSGYAKGQADQKAADAAATATSSPAPATTGNGFATASATTISSNNHTFKLAYADDFTVNAALGNVATTYPKMSYYDGFKDTSGLGSYSTAKTLSVHDSALDIYQHVENGTAYSAVILPDNYAPHTYGRFSIRYRTDKISGFKFVPLLWPTTDLWNDGEIDWPESLVTGAAPRPANAVPGTYSNGNMSFVPAQQTFAPTDTTAWHTATTEWTPEAIRFYWDDKLVTQITDKNAIPTKPFRYTIQSETWIGSGAVPANAAGHILIDWITIHDLSN